MHEWHLTDRVLQIDRRPLVMGIVNATPDSFSDGGQHPSPEVAVAHGLTLIGEGADLLDIGGESTRPGATPVDEDEELSRVVPVIRGLARQTSIPLSIDTSKAAVARTCVAEGAHIINDVTGLNGDPEMETVAAETGAGLVLMHMRGTPLTMQHDPIYENLLFEITQYFQERLRKASSRGIGIERIVLDPGIGFGKRSHHNLEIVARLEEFQSLGRPVCLGVSRKGFIGRMLENRPVERRIAGSLAAFCYAMSRGAVQIVRVHDVEQTRDAATVFSLIQEHVLLKS